MSSHKSTARVAAPLEPTRQRGLQRTAAILDAAALAFTERGFDGATMTEIAARSNTAIGSLYRFFPTKEVLADVLLTRYGQRSLAGLEAIAHCASKSSPESLADALVDFMLDLLSDRLNALALIDAVSDAELQRTRIRDLTRNGIAAILSATGHVPTRRIETVATLVLKLLKIVPPLVEEQAAGRKGLLVELRLILRSYLQLNWSETPVAKRGRGKTGDS